MASGNLFTPHLKKWSFFSIIFLSYLERFKYLSAMLYELLTELANYAFDNKGPY